MKHNEKWRRLAWLCLGIAASCVGCWKAQAPMNDKVEGTIKVNGVPLAGVVVEFVPDGVSGLLMGTAITDPKGHYEMQTGELPGAVLGKHSVIILVGRGAPTASRAADPQAAPADDNLAPPPPKSNPKVPPGFSDVRKPLLSVEVTADKHTDYDFDLAKPH